MCYYLCNRVVKEFGVNMVYGVTKKKKVFKQINESIFFFFFFLYIIEPF